MDNSSMTIEQRDEMLRGCGELDRPTAYDRRRHNNNSGYAGQQTSEQIRAERYMPVNQRSASREPLSASIQQG